MQPMYDGSILKIIGAAEINDKLRNNQWFVVNGVISVNHWMVSLPFFSFPLYFFPYASAFLFPLLPFISP